jgi:hypothetical protein
MEAVPGVGMEVAMLSGLKIKIAVRKIVGRPRPLLFHNIGALYKAYH